MANPERFRELKTNIDPKTVHRIQWLLNSCNAPPYDMRCWFLKIGHALGSNDMKHEGLAERLAKQAIEKFNKLLDANNRQEFIPWEAIELAKYFELGEEKVHEAIKADFDYLWNDHAYERIITLWQREHYDPGDGRLQEAARLYLKQVLNSPNRANSARKIGNQLFEEGVLNIENNEDLEIFEKLTEPEK